MFKLLILILIFISIIMFLKKFKNERFTDIETKGCLISKKITPEGGRYEFKVIDNVNQIDIGNSIFKPFSNEFTKEMCNGDSLGSGRKVGFECIDFLTKKEAEKHSLIFSNKTCYDNLDYTPDLPIYQYTA